MTKNIFVVCKDGEALLDIDKDVPGLEAIVGLDAKIKTYGLPDTQVGYRVEKVSEEAIKNLQIHPAVLGVYEGAIPLEQIKLYGDAGLQAGATVWNARFGNKVYIA